MAILTVRNIPDSEVPKDSQIYRAFVNLVNAKIDLEKI